MSVQPRPSSREPCAVRGGLERERRAAGRDGEPDRQLDRARVPRPLGPRRPRRQPPLRRAARRTCASSSTCCARRASSSSRSPSAGPYGRRQVWFGTSKPGAERFFQLEVDHLEDLRDFDFAAALAGDRGTPGVPLDHPLLVVCTHGKRDRCCAKNGRPLYDALRRETDSDWVWQSTHVGGDRFAGNVVVLPQALYYGRVEPDDAGGLLERTPPAASTWSATAAAPPTRSRCRRPSTRSARPRACSGSTTSPSSRCRAVGDDAWRVRFRLPDGAVHEVDVVAELADEPVYLTCGAAEPSRPRHFTATAVRRV